MTSQLMPEYEVEVDCLNSTIVCKSDCEFSSQCANHSSADKERRATGMTPDLDCIFTRWYCSKRPWGDSGTSHPLG